MGSATRFKHFAPGDFVPSFVTDSSVNPTFVFDTVAGRRVLLVFIGSGHSERAAALLETLIGLDQLLRRHDVLCYVVTTDPRDRGSDLFERATERFTIFWDMDCSVHAAYGMSAEGASSHSSPPILRVGAFLLRENLRLAAFLKAGPLETFSDRLADACADLPAPGSFITIDKQAPVLLVPEVLDREMCDELIATFEADGGSVSGFMREVNGMTRGLLDPKVKRRRDTTIEDAAMLTKLHRRLYRRLVPEIRKAFSFDATRIERFIVGCYDAQEQGFFRAHRDNTSKATAHRRFAVSINLNTGDYEGGELWFPEYGRRLYSPPRGGAVVFSCSLLHEARPVTRGRRYAFLPFLYDNAASEVRQQNRQFLDDSPAAPVDEVAAASAHMAAARGMPEVSGAVAASA